MLHEFGDRDVGVVYGRVYGVADLAQVVRRHLGCHTHGNTLGAVYEDIGYL